MTPIVVAVCRSARHSFSKPTQPAIRLIAGFGVEGDAHAGKTVKHRYFVKQDPTRPNIRQVHLIHQELLEELNGKGFSVTPGQLGENITTRGIALLELPVGTKLRIGEQALIQLTALRSPCQQIEDFQEGLLNEVLYKDEKGMLVRKTGVMGIVLEGGEVQPGDPIQVELPPEPYRDLEYIW